MQLFTSKIKSMALIAFCSAAIMPKANAAVFTAVASGNFNAASTWGGTAPSSLISSDVIIIPIGIKVDLTDDVTFSSSSSLTVLGSLSSSSTSGSGGALILTSGSLAGSGTIDVDSLSLGLTSGISFLGNISADNMTSTGTNVSTAANITVRRMLRLASGSMNMASGSLTLASGSAIEVTGGSLTSSGLGSIDLSGNYDVIYRLGATSTGPELNGSGLDSVFVDVSSSLSLAANTTINGALTLQSGILNLNNRNLTFNGAGNLSTMGTGTISGSSLSNIFINTTSSLSGSLRFTSGSNTLNDFTINTGSSSSSVNLGSDLNINGTLNLQSGRIRLGSNNLRVATGGTVSGGSSNSFVIADGTGRFTLNLAAGSNRTFNVGTSTDFTPMNIAASSGSVSSDVSLSVANSVMAGGTSGSLLSSTQPMVRNTWFVTSSATSGIDFTLTAMWNTALEANGFNRNQAFISHFTGGAWDATTSSSSTSVSGGMFSMTRAGITSLSPFMVTDKDAVMTTSIANVNPNNSNIVIYPNPATNTLYFDGANNIDAVKVYDQTGKLVKSFTNITTNAISVQDLPAGTYLINVDGGTQQFVKQ